MKFIDEVKLNVRSGDGGPGCMSFRREAFVPKGGPDGGNGGAGGDVVFVASTSRATLLDFRFKRNYKADNGKPGEGRKRYGKDGKSLLLEVPLGTKFFDRESGDLLADLTEGGQKYIAAKGGIGGRGNMHFATPTNQAPRYAQPGRPGETYDLQLKLSLIADVGLVGFPNAGKSTLISAVSAAKPKIADYPFTTLVPNLGVIRCGDDGSFVLADIPGLIEGASEGHGLGLKFLGHIERTKFLAFVFDVSFRSVEDVENEFKVLQEELKKYNPELLKKPRIAVFNKMDVVEEDDPIREELKAWKDRFDSVHFISAATQGGTRDLVNALGVHLQGELH